MSRGASLPIRQYFRLKISPSYLRPLLSEIRSELVIYKVAIQAYAQQRHKFLLSVLHM